MTSVHDYTNNITSSKVIPNPFNISTIISYDLEIPGEVNIRITDLRGFEIINYTDKKIAGSYEFVFDGSILPPGMYICNIRTGNELILNKLILNK